MRHKLLPTVTRAPAARCVSGNLRIVSAVAIDPWHALADPTRRRVFGRVTAGRCSVTEIARELPVSRPAVSQHLRVLLDAGLVDLDKQGREHFYRARQEGLAQLRQELESFWTQSLNSFKAIAEQSYQADTPTSKGSPS